MPDVDLDTGRLFVRRLKSSLPTSQPLEGDEIRALRAWLRQRVNAPCCNSPLVFLSERGPMTRQAFNYICAEVGKRASLRTKVHPHMKRHSCGFSLANKGRDTAADSGLFGTSQYYTYPNLHSDRSGSL
jgi:integrase